jgi:hypothetical protein
MPQNYRTRNVNLNQALYEQVQGMPACPPPNGRHFMFDEYRVVDVDLLDGRELRGLLAIDDSILIGPDVEDFDAEDIVAVRATPADEHPDFTITDREALYEHGGIEWMNSERLSLFGPPDPEDERDWRQATIDEAWDEALEDDSSIDTYGGEIPACYGTLHVEALTDEGVRVRYFPVGTEQAVTTTLRPRGIELWAALLGAEVGGRLEGLTLGGLIALLDLPEATARYVFAVSMPTFFGSRTFEDWVRGLEIEGEGEGADLDHIRVGAHADTGSGNCLRFFFDCCAPSRPLAEDDPSGGYSAGDSLPYSLHGIRSADLRHLEIRYEPRLEIPVPHEELMAFFRGALRDWRRGGEQGPRPETPVALVARREITFSELIGAIIPETFRAREG